MDLSNKKLLEIVKKGETVLCKIAEIPCYSQVVVRAGKIVSEAMLAVGSKEKRDGLIRFKLNSRSNMPFFGSKKDFVLGGHFYSRILSLIDLKFFFSFEM
jgi:hypothetical protein